MNIKRYILLCLLLLPVVASAKGGGETITFSNNVARGLSFSVSCTQHVDSIRFDIAIIQTNAKNDTLERMRGQVFLDRGRLSVPLQLTLMTNTLVSFFFVAVDELPRVTLRFEDISTSSFGITAG